MLQKKSKKILIYFFLFLMIGTFNNKNLSNVNFLKVKEISINGLDDFEDFKLIIDAKNEKKIQFQLAAWRPGRYELGNFSQNISNWRASNENNEFLNFKKITKDLWEVEAKSSKKIIITYSFFINVRCNYIVFYFFTINFKTFWTVYFS